MGTLFLSRLADCLKSNDELLKTERMKLLAVSQAKISSYNNPFNIDVNKVSNISV